MDADAYVESVRSRLSAAGFKEEAAPAGATLKARRRQVKLSRFGVVDTVVVVSTPRPQPDVNELKTFGAEAVRAALDGKSPLPRGLGNSLVVYPVLVAGELPDALVEFIGRYLPKHWSLVEFPVLVDSGAPRLVMRESTPVWGAAYYRKTRQDARDLLAPA